MKNIIIPPGAYPTAQELAVAKILANTAPVEFIPPLRIEGMHTPDILWDGKPWEIKTPESKSGPWTVNTTLKRAVKQSCNLIFDTRSLTNTEAGYIKELEKQFKKFRSIRHLKIITNSGQILDFIK